MHRREPDAVCYGLGMEIPARPILLISAIALGAHLGCTQSFASKPDWDRLRERMVDAYLDEIEDPRVREAMRKVPRHELVPEALRASAYENRPLPIGEGQTISQPYVVAAMTAALDPDPKDTVLEIGTGSGYQAAVLAELVKQVHTVEIVESLADRARADLARLGYDNVNVVHGDGHRGLPEHAPYDGIIVTAAPDEVPAALKEQLAVGGRLVIPVGQPQGTLMVYDKKADGSFESKALFGVLFVPMTGGER